VKLAVSLNMMISSSVYFPALGPVCWSGFKLYFLIELFVQLNFLFPSFCCFFFSRLSISLLTYSFRSYTAFFISFVSF
jgi:hypothetical protein